MVVKQGAAEEAERLTRANLERTAATLVASWERGHVPYWSPPAWWKRRKEVMPRALILDRVARSSELNIEEEKK